MTLGQSKISEDGRISVPEEVREKLGVGPGSILEWEVVGNRAYVRRSVEEAFDEIHRTAFPDGPPEPQTLEQLKEGIEEYIREKHARR